MHREIIHVCDAIENDNEMKVLVLTGGPDIFCTGADLADVSKTEDGLPTGPNAIERLNDMTKPTIAEKISLPLLFWVTIWHHGLTLPHFFPWIKVGIVSEQQICSGQRQLQEDLQGLMNRSW
jgi:hypothetical protein